MNHKLFFKIDLLLCSFWTLFVLHLWVANLFTSFCVEESTAFPEWTFPLVAYTLVMRLGINFMMQKGEKKGIYAALTTAVVGVICYGVLPKEVMQLAWQHMYDYSMVAVNYAFSPRWLTTELPPYTCYKLWRICLPIWLWIVPLLYFLLFRKRCCNETASLKTVLSGGYLFKDWKISSYLRYCAIAFIAWGLGVWMNNWVSLVAMILLPAYAYGCFCKSQGRKPSWIEFLLIASSGVLLWYAQYKMTYERNLILWGSALIALLPMLWGALKTREWINAFVGWVMIGILLPSFCLGYSVYTVKEAVRVANFRDEMCFTGVLKVKDIEGNVGLRDRYRLIVDTSFSDDVQAYKFPLVYLKRGERWGICNTKAAGYPKGDIAFPDSLGLFPMKSILEFYQPVGRISKWCDDKED